MSFSFFFNDTATTEIYTLSLHDALPISRPQPQHGRDPRAVQLARLRSQRLRRRHRSRRLAPPQRERRSEEHTSELQSRLHLVCRLLLEKKKILTIQDICFALSVLIRMVA